LAEERCDLLLVSAFSQYPSPQCVNSISKSRVYNSDNRRQVAILLPEVPCDDSIDNNLKNDSDLQWHTEATCRLNEIANQFGLQQLSTIDESIPSIQSIDLQIQHTTNTHYLTAIPYPRTNSYALSISTHGQQSSSNKSKRQQKQTKKKKKLKLTEPFYIDLHPPSDSILGYRMKNNKQKNSGSEMLIKALGIKKMISDKTSKEANDNQEEVIVYDLTAGLGRDSLVILSSYLDYIDSSNGNNEYIPRLRVHMVERDPIVALLLKDAMRRLHQLAASNQIDNDERSKAQRIAQCISMEEGDGVTVLNRFMMLDKDKELAAASSSDSSSITTTYIPSYPPDVCYLDPMFPPRKKKSSAVKKDMAMLHSLLGTAVAVKEGEETDETKDRIHEEQALLLAAYDSAQQRVVVKRPISALPLGLVANSDSDCSTDGDDSNIPKPSYDVRGSVNRFDVYIITR